jgi:acyl-CoA synthetase (NDP forming)
VVNRAHDRLLGMSAMVSTGNEADVTVAECLEHFADDPRTTAVALIVAGVRDGPRFVAAAGRLLAAGKPVVALKVGRARAGQRNALTHTGALTGSHAAWRAVARRCGIVDVESFDDRVDVAAFFVRARPPAGRRVGVLTTSGGASILTADALEARGLRLPRLSPATVRAIGQGLPEPRFAAVLAALLAEPRVDALVVAVTGAGGVERAETVARDLASAGGPSGAGPPDAASGALAALGPALGPRPRRAGVPLPAQALVATPGAAARAARRVGLPVAITAVAPGLEHETEAGAVVLDLGSAAAVEAAARRMLARLRRAGVRGGPPADLPALVDAIAALTRLAERLDERLPALEANPIVAAPRGCGVLAADLLASFAPPARRAAGDAVGGGRAGTRARIASGPERLAWPALAGVPIMAQRQGSPAGTGASVSVTRGEERG